MVVAVVIVLLLDWTELIEVASPRACDRKDSSRGPEDVPASARRRRRRQIIRGRYFRRRPREIASPREP